MHSTASHIYAATQRLPVSPCKAERPKPREATLLQRPGDTSHDGRATGRRGRLGRPGDVHEGALRRSYGECVAPRHAIVDYALAGAGCDCIHTVSRKMRDVLLEPCWL